MSHCKPSTSGTNQRKHWTISLGFLIYYIFGSWHRTHPFYLVHTSPIPRDQYLCSSRIESPANWAGSGTEHSQVLLLSGKMIASWQGNILLNPTFCWDWEELYQRAGPRAVLSWKQRNIYWLLQHPPSKPSALFFFSPKPCAGLQCLKHQSSLSLDGPSKQPGNTLPKNILCIAFTAFFPSWNCPSALVYPSVCF